RRSAEVDAKVPIGELLAEQPGIHDQRAARLEAGREVVDVRTVGARIQAIAPALPSREDGLPELDFAGSVGVADRGRRVADVDVVTVAAFHPGGALVAFEHVVARRGAQNVVACAAEKLVARRGSVHDVALNGILLAEKVLGAIGEAGEIALQRTLGTAEAASDDVGGRRNRRKAYVLRRIDKARVLVRRGERVS